MTSRKRNSDQVERDRLLVTELMLKGYTHQQIAEELERVRPYSLTRRQVSYDVATVRKRWLERQADAYNQIVSMELARLDILEKEAWRCWELSKNASNDTLEYVNRPDEESGEDVERLIRRYSKPGGGIGDIAWLKEIRAIQEERRRVIGAYAPAKLGIDVNRTDKRIVKAYVSLSPDSWPEPPEKAARFLSDGILEGEFE